MRGRPTRQAGWGAALLALALVCGCSSGPQRRPDQPIVLTPPPKQAEKPIVLDLPKKPVPHAPKVQVHVIAVGETLYHIAHAYDVTVEALAKANHIEDPTTLAVGQRLVIPRPPESDAEVVPEREAPASTRRTARAATIGHVGGVLDWPLRGVLYARFGKKGDDRHEGIDLAAPKGTPVKTAAPGKVIFAGEQEGYGLMAIVQHTAGFITLYAHDNDLRVKTGQHVREGQVIATVGESGRTSGPHLHFEVRKDGKPVDPLLFLKPPPSS